MPLQLVRTGIDTGDDHRPNGPAGDKRRGAARERRFRSSDRLSLYTDSRPASGRFSLANIPPGRYRLEARTVAVSAASGSSEWAEAEVTIDGRDLADVTLTMQPTVVVRGRIIFAGASEGDKAQPAATISMTPEDGVSGSWTRPLSATSKGGAFAIENMAPAKVSVVSVPRAGPGGDVVVCVGHNRRHRCD